VRAQHRPPLADPVAEPGPPFVEALDRLGHRPGVDVELAGQFGKQREERRGEVQLCHL
jgi:hypothetical protein